MQTRDEFNPKEYVYISTSDDIFLSTFIPRPKETSMRNLFMYEIETETCTHTELLFSTRLSLTTNGVTHIKRSDRDSNWKRSLSS